MTMAPARRTPGDKHDARRKALADSALRTLGELGYARASLREIAHNSEFSHGVVHYYFQDKLELLVFAVQEYKKTCVHRYDEVVAASRTPEELLDAFAAKLRETIVDEGDMHRLWYDLRSQSMFETRIREAVTHIDRTLEDMVWRVVGRYAELAGREPAVDAYSAYGMLDGLFQQALLGHLQSREGALDALSGQVHGLMPLMLKP